MKTSRIRRINEWKQRHSQLVKKLGVGDFFVRLVLIDNGGEQKSWKTAQQMYWIRENLGPDMLDFFVACFGIQLCRPVCGLCVFIAKSHNDRVKRFLMQQVLKCQHAQSTS